MQVDFHTNEIGATMTTFREHLSKNLNLYGLAIILGIVLLVYWLIPEYEKVQIDGCDYIKYHRYNQSGISHSGTCANPIHQPKARP